MSEAKADAREDLRVRQAAKHLRPDPTELVVIPAAQLYELIQRAVNQARTESPVLVDKQDLARQLGCSAAHIDHLRKRGLPTVQVGQVVRFEPGKVLDWLRENGAVGA
jgi:hypothetical protein